MRIDRGKVLDLILKKVGILKRVKPGSPYLSKRELIYLNTWVEVKSGRHS